MGFNAYYMNESKTHQLMSFHNFLSASIRVEDHQTEDVFNVYLDRIQQCQSLPESLEDAYGNGFLTISLYDSKFATWYLNIANEEYTGPLQKLERILFDWATAEGYEY
jgi:hypothetical protein